MTGTNINMRSERMPIGDGYSVTFSFASGRLEADWQPKVPYGRTLPGYGQVPYFGRNGTK